MNTNIRITVALLKKFYIMLVTYSTDDISR